MEIAIHFTLFIICYIALTRWFTRKINTKYGIKFEDWYLAAFFIFMSVWSTIIGLTLKALFD